MNTANPSATVALPGAGAPAAVQSKVDMNRPVIEARGVTKLYKMGENEFYALNGIDIKIYSGECVSIMGPSGSGKSTLMNILGCLDQPTKGSYKLDNVDTEKMNDNELAMIRNKKIGFVFQSFNLLRRTSSIDNVSQPLIYAGMPARQRRDRAREALEAVGLGNKLRNHANELSGGQQQRVAIARAIVTQPAIILADEPTGNLDSRSGQEIMCLFQRLNREQGITVVFVTHDLRIGQHTDRIIRISDGKITGDEAVTDRMDACI